MAIFFVKDSDAIHPNPLVSLSVCYKRGDIVSVYDDAKRLRLPPVPPFWLVKITGLDWLDPIAQTLVTPLVETQMDGEIFRDVMVRRRSYGFSQADIPAPMWAELLERRSLGFTEIGQTQITWGPAARNFLRHKLTGEPI